MREAWMIESWGGLGVSRDTLGGDGVGGCILPVKDD